MSESKYRQTEQLAELLAALSGGELPDDRQEQIERWRAESPENEALYREIVSGDFMRRKMRFVADNDIGQAYAEFLALANHTAPEEIPCEASSRKSMRRVLRWTAVAAVAAGIALLLLMPRTEAPVSEKVVPGSKRAILTTADGRTFDITGSKYDEIIGDGAAATDTAIPEETTTGDEVRHNVVTVPRGCEYTLMLGDGTQVWLNAESEIRIPIPFDRTVVIAGEAFFEVVANPDAPFTVGLRHGTVTVTGTSFNIRDYADEELVEATLIEGRITFSADGGRTEMSPGEQLLLDKASGEVRVEPVDTGQYAAWKDGRFVFVQQRLEDIMNTLARWYDIEVVFEDPALRDILFTGNIKKYDDFDSILKMLTMVNRVDIVATGRTVVVKP
jgi:ferric-dicitrate binding protein FerR (iron transport regulator)